MDAKKQYVYDLAAFLHTNGTRMSAAELAAHLNRNGFTTYYGTKYDGVRGTYTLIHATYNAAAKKYSKARAWCVAAAFVKPNGSYAYDPR